MKCCSRKKKRRKKVNRKRARKTKRNKGIVVSRREAELDRSGVWEEEAGRGEGGRGGVMENGQQSRQRSGDTAALLQRTMGALHEMNPELEDNQEEIRKLDSQLDHLSDYMDRVEERLKAHNDKLMETLRQQREDREKRRRSFQERLEQSRQEDDEFQQQLSSVLSRMDSVRNKKMETDGRMNAPAKNE
uniref:Uncharacterized protein n=1 Tax=Globodera rostochiensis TaxID=31243 RepID=A0A914GTU2_GLORO